MLAHFVVQRNRKLCDESQICTITLLSVIFSRRSRNSHYRLSESFSASCLEDELDRFWRNISLELYFNCDQLIKTDGDLSSRGIVGKTVSGPFARLCFSVLAILIVEHTHTL